MSGTSVRFILLGLTGFFIGISKSSPSPWKAEAEGKLVNGTLLTQSQFDANAFASTAFGQVAKGGYWAVGALVSNQYVLTSGALGITADTVYLGSLTPYDQPGFIGESYTISSITNLTASDIELVKIPPLPSTSKAKPVALPPAALKNKPPPVGSKCYTLGYFPTGNLNQLTATIVSTPECTTRWTAFDSTVVFPDNAFCAWVTTDGTANGTGSICPGDAPSILICEDWSPPKPPTPPSPSCGWHRSSGVRGDHNPTGDSPRALPSYYLAGIVPTRFPRFGNCFSTNIPPMIYAYTGFVTAYI